MPHTAASRLIASSSNNIFALPFLDCIRTPPAAMVLRRSARVNAISRPPVPPSKEDQIVEKVEPNRVAKRGKAAGKTAGNSKPLRTKTVSSPSTPKGKRNVVPGPPKTPTGAGLMSVPHGSRIAGSDSSPIPVNRPADPHQTNAPLVSPETSRVVAYAGRQAPSGTIATGPPATRTTENILEGACAHL